MQNTIEDCYYFLTSNCSKGSTCPYRHNPSVLTCNVICPAWLRGSCLDPACLLRHSAIQRPVATNGISCFYESTPMGCLKPDCTFIHLRSRPNPRSPSTTLRPSTTNLVNKDATKPLPIIEPPPTVSEPIPPPQPIIPPTPKVEPPPTIEIPSPTTKNETPPRRIPVPIENNQKKSPIRSVITDSSEKTPDNTIQSRMTGNRNVVIADSTSTSSRKVVHATISRVVVSSTTKNTNDSDSDIEFDDLIEQENHTTKTNSLIDIPFPCSVPSITNRLFMSSKPATQTTNDTKPIRLNRDRLPAAKISAPNPSNGENTSAGTGLSQDDDRRTNRIERFKKKPNSPPRSIASPNSNERKRPAPEQSINDSPPVKRLSSQQENNHHHNSTTIGDLCSPPLNSRRTHDHHYRRRRRSSSSSPKRKSSPRQTYSSTSSMNDSAWKKEVDEFLAKTTQPKITVLPQPVPLLSLRPRFIPPRQPPPPPPQLFIPRHQPPPQRPRQRPPAPVIVPPKPIEQIPPPAQIATIPKVVNDDDEDENKLLELDEPTDVVDTFALIDEALLDIEADHLLELT